MNSRLVDTTDQLATVRALFDVLMQLNKVDTREPWQMPSDATSSSAFGHVWKAIDTIAGPEFLECWNETGDLDPELIRHEVVEHTGTNEDGQQTTTYERKPTNNTTSNWAKFIED